MIPCITMPRDSMLQAAQPCSPSHSRVAAALRAGHASGRARRRFETEIGWPGRSRRATSGLPLRVQGVWKRAGWVAYPLLIRRNG